MKSKSLLLLMLILVVFAKAQTADTIVYNFSKGVYVLPELKPKYGKPIVFKITNINRFFYSPSIEGISGVDTDSIMGAKMPMKTPNTTQTPPDQVDNNVNNKDIAPTTLNSVAAKTAEKDKNNADFSDYKEKTVSNTQELYYNYRKKIYTYKKNFAIYVYIMNKYNSNFNNYLDKINTPDLTQEKYQKLYDDSNNSSAEVLERSSLLNFSEFQNKYEMLNKYEETKIDFLNYLNSSEIYEVMGILYKNDNEMVANKIKNEIEELKTYITNTDAEIKNMKLHKKLNFVEIVNRVLLDKESYEYISVPVQAYGDYLSFDVDIKVKRKINDEFALFNSSKKFSYKKFVSGGVRFDFGVGVSFDFGKKDEQYTIVENNQNEQILKETNKSDYTPKLVGLLHTSIRSSTSTAFGLSLGTALDVANFDISSIYLGPSVLFGRTDKVVFTAGPSFRKIKSLNPAYLPYASTALPDGFVLDTSKYTDNYKVGVFFSITYNLTNKQRKNFLQVSASTP